MEVRSPTWRPKGAQRASIESLRVGLRLPVGLAKGGLAARGTPRRRSKRRTATRVKGLK